MQIEKHSFSSKIRTQTIKKTFQQEQVFQSIDLQSFF